MPATARAYEERVAAAFMFACVHLDGTVPLRATVGRYEMRAG